MNRKIKPHKGGRTETLKFRLTPDCKGMVQAMAKNYTEKYMMRFSVADVLENLITENYKNMIEITAVEKVANFKIYIFIIDGKVTTMTTTEPTQTLLNASNKKMIVECWEKRATLFIKHSVYDHSSGNWQIVLL